MLIAAALPALWLWFLRRAGYGAFQGWWVDAALGGVLLAMIVIAVRRLSLWAGAEWRDGVASDKGSRDE